MERDEINAFTARLQAMLLDDEKAVIVSVGAKAPTSECDHISTTVTISARVGKALVTFTGNSAFDVESSARIARMKLRDARATHQRAMDKARAAKVPA